MVHLVATTHFRQACFLGIEQVPVGRLREGILECIVGQVGTLAKKTALRGNIDVDPSEERARLHKGGYSTLNRNLANIGNNSSLIPPHVDGKQRTDTVEKSMQQQKR